MATFNFVLFVLTVLVATGSAAPNSKKFDLKVPDECKDKGFCSIKPEGYDEMEDLINSLLPPHLIAQNIGDRIGDATMGPELSPESDWHNCPYRRTVEPAYAFIENNTTMDIIIQTKMYFQPIEIVTCANDKIQQLANPSSQECFQHLGLSDFNMKSTCQTTKATRRLLVFDTETRQVKHKDFDVNCCCTCEITSSV